MSAGRTYICVSCGKHKGEANHWHLVIEAPGHEIGLAASVPVLITMPWVPGLAELVSTRCVCGDACAVKVLSQFLGRSA